MTVAGRVIAVTGVTQGLGRALALVLAEGGAVVAGAGRRQELGHELQKEIAAAGGTMSFHRADLRDIEQCRAFIDGVVSEHGRVDVLVNNAAARTDPPFLPLHEVDESNWNDVMDTNVRGPFFCTSAAVDVMRRSGGGTIVNIASYSGQLATSQMAVYGMSKAALIQLARAVTVEYADQRVAGIAVVLGKTATGQAARYAAVATDVPDTPDEDALDVTLQAQDPVAVARAIALLCTEEARVYAGAVVSIDQGVSAGLYTSRFTYHLLAADKP